jgi:hypothetical protein
MAPPHGPLTFEIVSGTDKDYYKAFEAMRADGEFVYESATFGNLGPRSAAEFEGDDQFQKLLEEGMRVFHRFSFQFGNRVSVSIQRRLQSTSLFDTVSVNAQDPPDQMRVARLTAALQKHLGQSSVLNMGNLLGPGAKQHFEAREIALTRLEKMAADMLSEMEEVRNHRELQFEAKERALEEKLQRSGAELEEKAQKRQVGLDQRSAELDARSKELDDRAAKHARRQHYKDIKDRFKSWSETFQVTKGTSGLRMSVFITTLVLLALFGGLAGWFLLQTVSAIDYTHLIASLAKQITFTALFVSTAYFFIRWNNQWFQRHADEEFRLKRMELDIDRASWFVEMAFEWKEEKGEPIPADLIDRLTRGLFSNDATSQSVEPADSLVHALLGAAQIKLKLPGGSEVDYDQKAIRKVLDEGK